MWLQEHKHKPRNEQVLEARNSIQILAFKSKSNISGLI